LLPHHAMALLRVMAFGSVSSDDVTTMAKKDLLESSESLRIRDVAWSGILGAANRSMASFRQKDLKRTQPASIRSGQKQLADSQESEPLDIMVLISGEFGQNAISTVNSLAAHISQPGSVRLRVVGDRVGLASLQRAMEASGIIDASFLAATTYHDIYESKEFRRRVHALPFACLHRHNYGQVTWARFLFADILPSEVSKVVVMCIGDIIVLGDLAKELPLLYSKFKETEFIGLWKPLHVPRALHTGLVLVDVAKMRNSTFVWDFLQVAQHGVWNNANVREFNETPEEESFCKVAEYDVITHYAKVHAENINLVLGHPEWHYIPSREYADWHSHQYLPAGALGATKWVHYCETLLQHVAREIFQPADFGGAQNMSHMRDLLGLLAMRYSDFWDREDPANKQLCGKSVKLLHFPGFRLRRMDYVKWLLRWWTGVSGDDTASQKWNVANFRSDTHDVTEVDALGKHIL